MKRFTFSMFGLIFLLTACSGREPQRIASYPKADGPLLISPPAEVVYNAFLEMEVSDVTDAAAQAERLSYRYGGYLVSSRTWYQDDQKHTTVVLAAPAPNFDGLHKSILNLGTLLTETVNGQLDHFAGDGRVNTSYLTVNFRPRTFSWPSFPSGWDPGRTVAQAFGVFVTIFGFLVDIALWVLIVFGPFVLIGWGIWALARKLRR